MRHLPLLLAALAAGGCRAGERRPENEVTSAAPLPRRDNGLSLEVRAPAAVRVGDDFQISVIFKRSGAGEVVVLPHAPTVRLTGLGSARAAPIPLPGPPRNIWVDPRAIRQGQTIDVVSSFKRLSWGTAWKIDPGKHELTLRYAVGEADGTSAANLDEDSPLRTRPLWRGGVESPAVVVRFRK